MLKVSANISLLFTELPMLDRIKAASDNGFSGFELHFPYEIPIEDLIKVKEKTKMNVSIFNFPAGDFADGGPGIASISEREAHFRASVAEAKMYVEALKPYAINMLSGSPLKYSKKIFAKKIFLKNLIYAAQRFKDLNSLILIEPINLYDRPNYLINTTLEAIEVIQKSQLRNVRVLFDIYHMHRMGEDIIKTIIKNFPYIGHIQIADYPGRNQPGTGKINFDEIFQTLKKLKYDKWIGAEYNPKSTTYHSLSWLIKHGFE
ncbi:MAG: Hydroxypyruvate isomerase [Alphaproteobacteria bacterium MarineAlpha2_Bin1]|nr:MAG: Hydroxypyruvate isomerase [Alphaproteobacteria bacterium MarineAlpha2_Bin1]